MEEQKINLTLPLGMVNIIMASLVKMPYEVVSPVIDQIRAQASPQVNPPGDSGGVKSTPPVES